MANKKDMNMLLSLRKVFFLGFFLILLNTASSAMAEQYISEEDAIKKALAHMEIEVLGIRFDKPDKQWDVFIRSKSKAYEVEVDALNGMIIKVEEESLDEIEAELSGDLSHECVECYVDK